MNDRRSELQIVGGILELTHNGAKKTEILHRNNMGFTQINKYLTYLIERDLLDVIMVPKNDIPYRTYINTEKGNDLLVEINKILPYLE